MGAVARITQCSSVAGGEVKKKGEGKQRECNRRLTAADRCPVIRSSSRSIRAVI